MMVRKFNFSSYPVIGGVIAWILLVLTTTIDVNGFGLHQEQFPQQRRSYHYYSSVVVQTSQRRQQKYGEQIITSYKTRRSVASSLSLSSSDESTANSSTNNYNNIVSDIVTSRLPTSVDDQIRQATVAIQRATADGIYRHTIRLLLPVIGATELDDWPGGARQQMEAANPLVQSIIRNLNNQNVTTPPTIQTVLIDESDGVAALFVQAASAKDDSCTILLPTAETVTETVQSSIESQVGKQRNLILVNPQWRRKTDFGSTIISNPFAFGNNNNNNKKQSTIEYVEQFVPTFSLTNLIVEGESIRILRTYPGPWRVYLQTVDEKSIVDWILIGTKDVITIKPNDWDQQSMNQRDGGLLFNYGQPNYQDVSTMIQTTPNYKAKTPAERAVAAFNFIKDSL